MENRKFPVLAESGYPRDYDLFKVEMQAMWNDVVPEERRAQLERFGRYISGEGSLDESGDELTASAAEMQNSGLIGALEMPSRSRPWRALKKLFGVSG